MSGGWAEWRWTCRRIPGFVWVQASFIWHPRYWQKPRWANRRYRGIVTDYAFGPLWFATMREGGPR